MVVGLAAAATSWWFRYSSTHRAAQFWGPEAVRLIRDAPQVLWRQREPNLPGELATDTADNMDLSDAHGLTHLRAALMEDSSYDWSASAPPDVRWSHSLTFVERGDPPLRLAVYFSTDFEWAKSDSRFAEKRRPISTRPIAAGLRTFFAEQPSAAR